MKIRVKKLDPRAKVPQYAHGTDAGLDLFCLDGFAIAPGEMAHIATGIAIELPEGYTALVWDKGSIASKRRLKVMGGVFDVGYTGDYTVLLHNLGTETQVFEAGDKIAQLIIQRYAQAEVELVDELAASPRGAGRFGSTGKA